MVQLDSSATELDNLEAHVQGRLGGRVRFLQVLLRGQGIVLKGRAHSYYVKQLAQHAVMQTSDYPILANEIEVS
jgi:hypothetical protein